MLFLNHDIGNYSKINTDAFQSGARFHLCPIHKILQISISILQYIEHFAKW